MMQLACTSFMFLLLFAPCGISQPTAKQALLDFKASVHACNESALMGWLASDPISDWPGITVQSGQVTAVNLSNAGLCGELPAHWRRLTSLTSLDLEQNILKGSLPDTWTVLSKLSFINLGYNSLTGPLPESWAGMHNLRQLLLRSNSLSGPLPRSWSQLGMLQNLSLSANQLTGPLPLSWSSLVSLQYLRLSSNRLNGTLPLAWSILQGLTYLNLGNNSLTGPAQPAWSALTSLVTLSLSSNSLTGRAPSEWSILVRMASLSLGFNSLNGSLPSSWAALHSLTGLYMSTNRMDGPLPPEWMELTSLQDLYLYNNSFTKRAPVEWSVLTNLSWLGLEENALTGPAPTVWSELTNLRTLALAKNSLTGPAPAAWRTMTKLREFYFHRNLLTGTVPAAWGVLTDLTVLTLANNSFSGTLPASWSQLQSLVALYLQQNHFQGPVPSAWEANSTWWNDFIFLDVSNNQLTGTLPRFPLHIQYFNGSKNSFTGRIPELPAFMVYLHLGTNQLSGPIPDAVDSSMVFMDLSNNQLELLPSVFRAPNATYLNLARNRLHGTLPTSDYSHALLYCNLSHNQLSGSIPKSWHERSWLYLALDHNHFNSSSSLSPSWLGNVTVLLLQHNRLSGCLPGDWPQNSSAKIVSFASNNITCLPGNWSSFRGLSLLDVSNVPAKVVPLPWMYPKAFNGSHTVLRIGRQLWLSSKGDKDWQRKVCIQKDLNGRLAGALKTADLASSVQGQIQNQVNMGLANVARLLRALNVTFVMGKLDLKLDDASNVTVADLCKADRAEAIVIVQWSLVGIAIVVLCALYVCEANRKLLSSFPLFNGHSCMTFDVQQRQVPRAQLMLSLGRSTRFAASLVLYWFDVISDIVLITQVWEFQTWLMYALLGVLLFHYVVALALMVWRVDCSVCTQVMMLVFGLPFMPLLDTAMFVLLAVRHLSPVGRVQLFQSLSIVLQWEDLFEMREVLEVFIEALPTAVLQTAVFVIGNRPEIGWYLDSRLYLISAVASSAQILRLVAVVLLDSLLDKLPPRVTLWRKLSQKWAGSSGSSAGAGWSADTRKASSTEQELMSAMGDL